MAVICFGVRYAIEREKLRSPDHLHVLYQETNKDWFRRVSHNGVAALERN